MNKNNKPQQDKQNAPQTNKPSQVEQSSLETAVFNPIPILQRAVKAPQSISPNEAKTLQATIGNQALRNLTIQRKMTLGPVGDKYEQEADAVAAQVVNKINAPTKEPTTQRQEEEEEVQMQPLVQRQEEEELQMQPLPAISKIQRQEEEEEVQMQPLIQRQEEEEEVQMQPLVQRQEEEEEVQAKQENAMLSGGALTNDMETAVNSAKSSGQPISNNVREPMEQAFSADFSNVKIHTDSQSDTLNRSLNARAFTSGQDVFFRSGEYNPTTSSGQELLAHELTHTVQQGAASLQKKQNQTNTIQRRFEPAKITSNAHLRDDGAWETFKGSKISKNSIILADNNVGNNKKQVKKRWVNETWKPAINVLPTSNDTVPNDRKGYVRNSKVSMQPTTLEGILKDRLTNILRTAEQRHPSMAGHLTKDDHIDFLLDKGLRYSVWKDAKLDTFSEGFTTRIQKFNRIQDGANYVADSLEHWRKWLHPQQEDGVRIENVKLVKSDLHERGLGVVQVSFSKPPGGTNPKFSGDTNVNVMIKPEDKSLEENLLGDKPDSTANKINRIVGLTDPNEILTTIKMQSDAIYGSLVELVNGIAAEDLGEGPHPVTKSYHETLVFSFLAGIDDLHKENVFYDDGGRPYLIDADNVMSYNQMINKDNGQLAQSGFGSSYNTEEANKNKKAIQTGKNTVNSKILKAMLTDNTKKIQIIDAIKDAIKGKEGRVVPIMTRKWGEIVKYYTSSDQGYKGRFLDDFSQERFIVREGVSFDTGIGPGLIGTSAKNKEEPFYSQSDERTELKKDWDAGVIPFYVYDYDSGHVTHNGTKIYHGQTLEQGMDVILDKFDPDKTARYDRMLEKVLEKTDEWAQKIEHLPELNTGENSEVDDSEWDD